MTSAMTGSVCRCTWRCTGMRRGEMIALRWADLDLAKGTLQVSRSVEEIDGTFRFKH